MSSLPAGWYKDPADPTTQRYWDGEGWLGKAIPADAVPPDGPPPVEEEPPPAPAPEPASPAAAPPPPAWMPPPPQQQQAPPGWGPMPPPPPGWQPPPGAPPPPPGSWQYTPYPVQARPHGFALAGLGPRLAARLLDILAVLLLNIVVNGYFAYQFWQEFLPTYRASMDAVANGQSAFDVQPASGRTDSLLWIMLIVATLLWLLYEAPSTASTGQTLGKRLMRIKVVAIENTEPIGFGRAFGRWARLGLWTPAWGCAGFGLVMQFIDSISPLFDQQLRQAFHDKTARTVVVALPPDYEHPAPRKDDNDSAHSR
jgi:uncharacterized RDD family membrane protein YckC